MEYTIVHVASSEDCIKARDLFLPKIQELLDDGWKLEGPLQHDHYPLPGSQSGKRIMVRDFCQALTKKGT